jgi:PKD repeat protein
MTYASGTYSGGARYWYVTSELDTGFHAYYFEASDNWGATVRLPPDGNYEGPDVEAPNTPPTALFTYWPERPTINDVVQFTDQSADLDGAITSWFWDFGDGITSTVRNPSHQYSAAGIYTVILTVTDNGGATDEVYQLIVVGQPPMASFVYSPTHPTTDNLIQFTDESADSDGTVVSWSWDFGDKSTSVLRNPTHRYPAAGTYAVTLTVTDNDGLTDNETRTITVLAIPIASFTYSPASPTTDNTIQLTDNSSDLDGTIVSWSWDFGDGKTSVLQNPTHQYSATGTYAVTLTVTDDDGLTSSVAQVVSVSAPPAPRRMPTTLSISPSSFTMTFGRSVNLTATLRDENGAPLTGKTITWSATGGSLSAASGTTDDSGQVSITFTAPTVAAETVVTVGASFAGDDEYGASEDISVGAISPPSPTSLTITPASFALRVGGSVTLTATLTSDSAPLAGKTLTWEITSGEIVPSSGTTDSLGQATATYTAPGFEDNVVVTVRFPGNDWYLASSSDSRGVVEALPPVEATVDIKPDALQIGAEGRWVTCYVELPEGNVEEIDISSILLERTVPVDNSAPAEVGDHDGDGSPDLMVKFDRPSVENLVSPGIVTLTVTGSVGETTFTGSDVIDVIMAGPGALVSALRRDLGKPPEVREEVYNPNLRVVAETGDNLVTVSVSSDVSAGATIAVNVDRATVAFSSLDEIEVRVDGAEIEPADGYEDVHSVTDENDPEYLLLLGGEGIQVLVSIPHFSVRTITIRRVAPEVQPAPTQPAEQPEVQPPSTQPAEQPEVPIPTQPSPGISLPVAVGAVVLVITLLLILGSFVAGAPRRRP